MWTGMLWNPEQWTHIFMYKTEYSENTDQQLWKYFERHNEPKSWSFEENTRKQPNKNSKTLGFSWYKW